jgi:hypothetical protein
MKILKLINNREWDKVINELNNIEDDIWNGNKLVHYIGHQGDIKLYNILKNKVDFDHKNNEGNTVLLLLIKNGFIDLFKKISKQHPTLILRSDNKGDNVFHFLLDDINLFKYILNLCKKHKFNYKLLINFNINDNTPLLNAVKSNKSDIIKLCIENNIDLYKPKDNPIIMNIVTSNMTQKEIIDILKLAHTKTNIFENDIEGNNILFFAIKLSLIDLIKYLLHIGFDPNYKNNMFGIHLLRVAYSTDVANNDCNFTLYNLLYNNKIDVTYIDNNGNNFGHFLLINRINKHEGDFNIEKNILSKLDSVNNLNVFGNSILHYIVQLNNSQKYLKIIENKPWNIFTKNNKNKNVYELADDSTKQILLNKISNKQNKTNDYILKHEINQEGSIEDIKLLELNYVTFTNFHANDVSLMIYINYIISKYNNITVPYSNYVQDTMFMFKHNSYILNVLQPEFFIRWESNLNYYIHPNLNNLIKKIIKEAKYEYILLYIGMFSKINHANILLYDLKNKTIERFEPFGDVHIRDFDDNIDVILKNELSINNYKYISSKDYSLTGVQLLSNENSNYNIKKGDFGGFCLAWVFWYIELKLMNKIHIDKLLPKTIKKILNNNISFIEMIRNYSNHLNNYYNDFIVEANIDIQKIGNKFISNEDVHKIIKKLIYIT